MEQQKERGTIESFKRKEKRLNIIKKYVKNKRKIWLNEMRYWKIPPGWGGRGSRKYQ
jgi:hypothetical protein